VVELGGTTDFERRRFERRPPLLPPEV